MSPLASHLLLWGLVLVLVAGLLPPLRRLERRCLRGCTRECCMPTELHPYLNDDVPASLGGSRDASNPDRWRL